MIPSLVEFTILYQKNVDLPIFSEGGEYPPYGGFTGTEHSSIMKKKEMCIDIAKW